MLVISHRRLGDRVALAGSTLATASCNSDGFRLPRYTPCPGNTTTILLTDRCLTDHHASARLPPLRALGGVVF
ncbi:hypothetical protein [Mycobacterium lepromatosis]|uniref:hypothetical protein n=1 Tax=Mycobacterium lepromatosis TaxID=480418 RepID=UPI000ADBEC47|nr:hypothetical protein [Mycobacterium lepromatosis]